MQISRGRSFALCTIPSTSVPTHPSQCEYSAFLLLTLPAHLVNFARLVLLYLFRVYFLFVSCPPLALTAPLLSVEMATASTSLLGIFGGSRAKKQHLGDAGSSTVSLDTQMSTGNAGAVSGSSSSAPLNAQQPRSFAQAAGGSSLKRSGLALPAFPRPQLHRGKPLVEHKDYLSMERPAPATPAPNVLYADMRSSP